MLVVESGSETLDVDLCVLAVVLAESVLCNDLEE